MVAGDLAPTYSNIYPEILDPLLPEAEFRRIIAHVNSTLVNAHNPYSVSNILDGALGFVTGWIWEDFRSGGIKGNLRELDRWIEAWNRDVGSRDGVRLIGLRRTGYLSLDIQIPDPQVRVVNDGEDGEGLAGDVVDGNGNRIASSRGASYDGRSRGGSRVVSLNGDASLAGQSEAEGYGAYQHTGDTSEAKGVVTTPY